MAELLGGILAEDAGRGYRETLAVSWILERGCPRVWLRKGDSIELCDDSFHVRLDIRVFNEPLARVVVDLARSVDRKLVMDQRGRIAPAEYAKLATEISR